MKRIIITAITAWTVAATASAQQPLTPTQHAQMRTMLNPAASLMHQGGELATVGRRQWVGIEGAPSVLWGSGYIGFESIAATAGVNIRHESLGTEKLTEASAYFAKAIRISQSEYLGMSLNAGVSHLNGKFAHLDTNDPAFRDDIMETDALIGFGLVLYRPERYYVGLSMPRLMLSNLGTAADSRYHFRNQYHLTAGALFHLGSDFHLRPNILVTYAQNLRPQAELSTMVFASRLVGLGINLRSYGEIAGMVQFNFGGLGIGYGYQFNPRNEPMNQRIENTTHEIGITYRFGRARGLL